MRGDTRRSGKFLRDYRIEAVAGAVVAPNKKNLYDDREKVALIASLMARWYPPRSDLARRYLKSSAIHSGTKRCTDANQRRATPFNVGPRTIAMITRRSTRCDIEETGILPRRQCPEMRGVTAGAALKPRRFQEEMRARAPREITRDVRASDAASRRV